MNQMKNTFLKDFDRKIHTKGFLEANKAQASS